MISLVLMFSFIHLRQAGATSIEPLLTTANSNQTVLSNTFVSGFANSPTYRGTTDILWTCILTTVACIYTCIHLHVPSPDMSTWKQVLEKLRWAAVTLIAPEMVLYAALKQFLDARSLVKDLNAFAGSDVKSTPRTTDMESMRDTTTTRFSLTYGFFAVMGGISISTEHIHETQKQITLSHHGVRLLAKSGHFIDITEDEIAARSRASPIAKALVCVQALWMVIQCSARAAHGYPLALLEIHTMVHVLCAIVIYILWWKKPQDVAVPLIIDSSKFQDILSLILMSIDLPESDAEIGKIVLHKLPVPEIHNIETGNRHAEFSDKPRSQNFGRSSDQAELKSLLVNTELTLIPGQRLLCGLQWGHLNEEPVTLTTKDIHRWQLYAEALSKSTNLRRMTYPVRMNRYALLGNNGTHSDETHADRGISASSNGIINTITGFPNHPYQMAGMDDWEEGPVKWILFMMVLFPIAYGGTHLAARKFSFPSTPESLLWQIACIGIMTSTLPIGLLLYISFLLEQKIQSRIETVSMKNRTGNETLDKILGIIDNLAVKTCYCWFCWAFWSSILLFYLLARVFIVVEAFLSLRRVPLGVFVTVSWLQSVAHV